MFLFSFCSLPTCPVLFFISCFILSFFSLLLSLRLCCSLFFPCYCYMQIMFSLLADPVFMRGCLSWRNAPAVLDRDGNDCLIRDRDLGTALAIWFGLGFYSAVCCIFMRLFRRFVRLLLFFITSGTISFTVPKLMFCLFVCLFCVCCVSSFVSICFLFLFVYLFISCLCLSICLFILHLSFCLSIWFSF